MTQPSHRGMTRAMMKNGSQHTTNAPVMIANVLAAFRSRFASSDSFFSRFGFARACGAVTAPARLFTFISMTVWCRLANESVMVGPSSSITATDGGCSWLWCWYCCCCCGCSWWWCCPDVEPCRSWFEVIVNAVVLLFSSPAFEWPLVLPPPPPPPPPPSCDDSGMEQLEWPSIRPMLEHTAVSSTAFFFLIRRNTAFRKKPHFLLDDGSAEVAASSAGFFNLKHVQSDRMESLGFPVIKTWWAWGVYARILLEILSSVILSLKKKLF